MSDQPPPEPSDPFAQQPGWGAPTPPPAEPPPGSGAPPPGSGAPPPGYGAPPPGYGAPPPAYGYPQTGYGNPAYGYGAPAGPKPDSYLIPAILTTLFCCLPSGIAAIVFAAQVDSKYARGDYQGAVASAKNAKTWTWISVGLGLVAIVLWVIFLVAVGGSTNDPSYYD